MKLGWSSFTAAFSLGLLLLAVTFASCIYDYSECPSGQREFRVAFDWERSPQADVAGMTLYFYPLDEEGSIWRFDIAGRDGGQVELPFGRYTMIAFNNDLPGIRLEGTGSASTLQAAMQRSDVDNDSVYGSTGMLYKATVGKINVSPCGLNYSIRDEKPTEARDGTVSCQPDSLATQFDVRLRNVKGLESIRSARVILYGLRASMFLEDGHASEIPAALGIGMSVDSAGSGLCGSVCGFEASGAIGEDYALKLLVVTADGTTLAKHITITSANLNVITRHNVLITADNVEIPDHTQSGDISGIGADVEGWEVVNIEVGPTIGNY